MRGEGEVVGTPLAGFIFDFTGSRVLPFSVILLLILDGYLSPFLYERKAFGASTAGMP